MEGVKRKRCFSIVRRRAINFLRAIDAKELPVKKAQELFSQVTDLWDRTTKKAYFGTQKHVSKRDMNRIARYGTGTFSFKHIELVQLVRNERGYLEKLGLVHYELRGKTWFMVIHQDPVLLPQLYERKQLSMKNISLSSNSQNNRLIIVGKENEKTSHEVVSVNSILETNNNIQDEREKSVDKTVFRLNELEKAILKAEPCKEPDKTKIVWEAS
jgi:hypothetical protein